MLRIVVAAVLVTGGLVVQAAAQTGPVRPNERWCLQESGGFRGANSQLCRFETEAQCKASKTAPSDFCFINPRLAQPRK